MWTTGRLSTNTLLHVNIINVSVTHFRRKSQSNNKLFCSITRSFRIKTNQPLEILWLKQMHRHLHYIKHDLGVKLSAARTNLSLVNPRQRDLDFLQFRTDCGILLLGDILLGLHFDRPFVLLVAGARYDRSRLTGAGEYPWDLPPLASPLLRSFTLFLVVHRAACFT